MVPIESDHWHEPATQPGEPAQQSAFELHPGAPEAMQQVLPWHVVPWIAQQSVAAEHAPCIGTQHAPCESLMLFTWHTRPSQHSGSTALT